MSLRFLPAAYLKIPDEVTVFFLRFCFSCTFFLMLPTFFITRLFLAFLDIMFRFVSFPGFVYLHWNRKIHFIASVLSLLGPGYCLLPVTYIVPRNLDVVVMYRTLWCFPLSHFLFACVFCFLHVFRTSGVGLLAR